VGNDPVEGPDLDPEVVDNHTGAEGEDPADETYWPTGELKLSPTAMWMEHKGWAS